MDFFHFLVLNFFFLFYFVMFDVFHQVIWRPKNDLDPYLFG